MENFPQTELVPSGNGNLPLIPAKRKCSISHSGRNKFAQSAKSDLSLELLPSVILDCIFQYVSSADLLNLCWLSKSLYWPAVRRIYRFIFTFLRLYNPLRKKDLHELYGDHWEINCGTVLSEQNFEKLASTLRDNESLASFVHGLSVGHENLVPWTPNLKNLNYESWGPYPDNKLKRLETLQCSVWDTPTFTDCLAELTLHTHPLDKEEPYRASARNLIELNVHQNLRKLLFRLSNYNFAEEQSGSNLSDEICDGWLSFMDEFRLAGARLHLHSLEVQTITSKPPAESSELVSKAVDLKNLQTLVLNCHDRHPDDPNASFVDELTKHTSLLKYLLVNTGPIGGLCRALVNNIPHQLEELLILMSHDEERTCGYGERELDRRIVQEAILASQSNLRKLKLYDKCSFRTFNESAQNIIDELHYRVLRDHYFFKELYEENPFTPKNIHWRPFISAPVARRIEGCKEMIHQCLKTDLIYPNSALNFPNLIQYYIGGFYVDVKQRGIFVNGRTMLFDSNRDRKFTAHGR